MFFYRPTEAQAWANVQQLETAVWFGSLVRNMHRWGAHLMVLSVFLHMSRVFYHGAYKAPREFNWVIGVILLTLTLLLSFTGYLLPWDQLALWAVTVGTNMMGYTPVFGGQMRYALLGSKEISRRHAAALVHAPRAPAPVRHRHLHGDPLLARPQGRRHQWTAVGRGGNRPMAEVPEHLLKRSAERRKQLGLPAGEGGEATAPRRDARPPTAPRRDPGGDARAAPRRARRRGRDHRGQGRRARAPARALPQAQGRDGRRRRRRRRRRWPSRAAAVATAPIAHAPPGTGPGRSHPAAADRRQVGFDPADPRRGAGQGPHLAAPARRRVRGRRSR